MNERPKGHCKHGEFILTEGCPDCIQEERERREAEALGESVPEPETEPIIVKVQYFSESTGEPFGREYCYFSLDWLKVGDVVEVPMRDRVQKAVVTATGVPESEIESFRDQVKMIPSGSVFPGAQAPPKTEIEYQAPPELTAAVDKVLEEEGQAPPEDPPGMALVKFQGEDELAVRKLFQEGVRLRNFAQVRIISTNEDLKPATDDLAIIKKTKTALEEHMKDYVGPIQDHLKQVRAAFGELLAPFDEADQLTRDKVKEFRVIEQKKLALAREEAAAKGGEFTTELQQPVPEHTRTALGTQGFQKVHKWEVEDFAQVPDQYKMIDAGKVTGVVKGSKGTIEIPGIRIWTDEAVRINTK